MSLTVMAGGRRRKLFRRQQGGFWFVRFVHQGKDMLRSTGTTIETVAKVKARQLVEAEMAGDVEKSRTLKQRSDYCTLRQIADVYVRNFGTDRRRWRTALNNVSSLKKLARVGAGKSLEDARSNILNAELVRDYEAAELQRIERDSRGFMVQLSELRVRSGINSIVKQAKSIFKRSTLIWFTDLALPDLTSFRDAGVMPPDRPSPKKLNDGVIEQLNAAAPQLALDDPPVYIAYLLFSRLGMRNSEIRAARMSWIRFHKARGIYKLGVHIRPEEGFKPKTKTERDIPMSAAVFAEIQKHWKPSPDGDFIIPAIHRTDRHRIVDHRHAAWCGQWIKGRSKRSYELRRYAGSLILDRTGNIEIVQRFLGHGDQVTTRKWYAHALRDDVPAIDMDDFVLGPVTAPGQLQVVR